MIRKKPYIAELHDVTITREGELAVIMYKEEGVAVTHLQIGKALQAMSDQQILDCHNRCIKAELGSAKHYPYVAVEIPPGKPQTDFSVEGYWEPRGDVLRCHIEDGQADDEAVIRIDDNIFTMREFGQLLSVYTGWGMRITMVPDDDVHVNPAITISEPDDDNEGSIALGAAYTSKTEH